MGNSRWRLQTTLNYVAQRVHELDREDAVEVLVADWGSEIPLREVLELSPAAARIVSFILIPPAIARDLQKDSPFPEVLALNAAARRAGGEYIGRIDQDTLIGKRFLQYFFDLYEGRRQLDVPLTSALLFANRRSIPYRFAVRCPPLIHVDTFIRVLGQSFKVWRHNRFCQDVFWTSYVGIWLLHRDLWNACGGYDERLIYYNWMETDMILRLAQNHNVIDLGKMVGYDFYHLEHYSPVAWSARIHAMKNPDIDLSNPPKVLQPNGENWGLIQFPLEVLRGSSNRTGVELTAANEARSSLPALIFLTVATATETVYDKLIVTLMRASFVWKSRALVAWNTIKGEPVIKWPRLLIRRWIERKSARKNREIAG